MDSDRDSLIERFVNVTGSSRYLAEQYLTRNKDDLMKAIEDFYAANDKEEKPVPASGPTPGGIRTLRDLNDDDSDDKKTDTNFFTGGEKSALQVEDPNKKKDSRSIIDDIFQTARDQMDQPDDRASASHEPVVQRFTGSGFKLGDGVGPSTEIADPSANRPKRPEKVNREIIFWRQGFTIADGPLHRYDDPNNQFLLQELNQGRVPISLLNVEYGQDVDVSVIRKTDEDYAAPKKKAGGFGGSGQRLGSPVPGESTPEPQPQPEKTQPTKPKDEGEGDTLVQIRFANGKRAAHRFNSADPISVVYDFVATHEHSTPSKTFILSHSFPVKPIENAPEVTVASAGLKNAVIVQRWA